MTDYSLDARVECSDGHGGKVTATILDPATRHVTHLVVRTGKFGGSERIVPIERVGTTSHDSIQLLCTRDELSSMDLFVDTQYAPSEEEAEGGAPIGMAPYLPLAGEPFPTSTGYYPIQTENI